MKTTIHTTEDGYSVAVEGNSIDGEPPEAVAKAFKDAIEELEKEDKDATD